jgi:hypothetical protein
MQSKTEPVGRMRVVKKLSPSDRGAIKLAEQFGETLLCVRHRVDAKAKVRFTTVELLVGKAFIRTKQETLVGVRIDWEEQSLLSVARGAGAKWDGKDRVWRMPSPTASSSRSHMHGRMWPHRVHMATCRHGQLLPARV